MVNTMGWIEGIDGTELYFQTTGTDTGKPPIIFCDGIGCAGYVWKYIKRDFADEHQMLQWNYRGHGQSAMPEEDGHLTIEAMADDLNCIVEKLDMRPAIIMGHSMGVQVILEYARRHPQHVAGLVPICGSSGNLLDTFHDRPYLKMALPFLQKAYTYVDKIVDPIWERVLPTEIGFQFATHTEVNGEFIKREDFFPYLEDLSQVEPGLFLEMLGNAQQHSAKDFLPQIDVPTLVIAGERDGFTPAWLSKEMARSIPGAEMLMIPSGSHTASLEMPELTSLRLEKWLNTHFKAKKKSRSKARSKKPAA